MAIKTRAVTKTTTYDMMEGGYVYYDNATKRRKMTAAEQAAANREYDSAKNTETVNWKKYRGGRNVSISSNTANFRGESSYAINPFDRPATEEAPAPKKKTPPPPKPGYMGEGVGKLPLKKANIKQEKAQLAPQKKLTTEVPVAVEKPTKKALPKSKGGISIQKTTAHYRTDAGRKLAEKLLNKSTKQKIKLKSSGFVPADKTARKAVKAENKSTRAARRTFGKEEKLATAYLKNQGIFEGDTKKEMKAGIKSYAKAKKVETGKIDKTTKQAIKTGKTAAKYVGRLEKGKIRSFTPEALAKRKTVAAKVQTTTTGKGKGRVTTKTIVASGKAKGTQAGRNVY